MKRFTSPLRRTGFWGIGASLLAAGLALQAATPPIEFEDVTSYGWFFRAGGRAIFNIKANVNRIPATVTPGVYDNGFVLPDVNGTASGRTWNWGYQDASQVGPANEVRLQRIDDLPMAGLFNRSLDPALGGEILTGTEVARFFIGRRESRVGVEIGYGYNAVSLDETSTAGGVSTLIADAFGLGATVPPPAPYTGSFQGPGPQLNLQPSLSGSVSSRSTAQYQGELENNLHTFKFGVWMEYPIARRLTANLSLGYASMYADSRLRFTEDITFDNPGIEPIHSGTRTVAGRGWKMGGYSQLRLKYELSRSWGVYLGGDFETHNPLRYQGENRDVTVDLGTLFGATAGVVFSF